MDDISSRKCHCSRYFWYNSVLICRCCRRPQLSSSLPGQTWSKFNFNLLRKFKFKFTGKLIPIISSFNVLSQTSKVKLKKTWGFKFKTLPQHAGRRRAATARRACRPGVTAFLAEVTIHLKHCRCTCCDVHWQSVARPLQRRQRRGSARVSHIDWLQAWLGAVVQALLFLRCSNPVMLVARHQVQAPGASC